MWVGLSKFISQKMEPTRLFSYLYDNPKCFTFSMEQVPYSLRLSERRSINNLTRRFTETLVMYLYPQDMRAVAENREDCIVSFIESIYETCIDNNASVIHAMEVGDNPDRFIKLTKQQLKDHHDYTKSFDEKRIVNIISRLSIELEINRRKPLKWDRTWGFTLLDSVIKNTKE